uniref:Uncharacterized protein n=1 Tax=Brassica campestris TaxID=3711 RepID=M4F5M8_BRACM
MKSQQEYHTREEIDQLVEEIYRALDFTEERLDGRCDDIYFSMDLRISALTSKIEAIQGELVEIQSYIARPPEAPASIDRRYNISTNIHRQTSVDDATNRGRQVPKAVRKDIFTKITFRKNGYADFYGLSDIDSVVTDFDPNKSLGDRLQKMENITATLKEKWRRGNEAMRDFTDPSRLERSIRKEKSVSSIDTTSTTSIDTTSTTSIDTTSTTSIDTTSTTSIDTCDRTTIDSLTQTSIDTNLKAEESERHQVNAISDDDFGEVLEQEKLEEDAFLVESCMSIGSSYWCQPPSTAEQRSTSSAEHRSTLLLGS